MGNGPTNGLEFLLSDKPGLAQPEQEKIAIEFLKVHGDLLRALARFPSVEALHLGLPYRLPLNAVGCCPGPSAELMLNALKTGVMPSYYVMLAGRQIDPAPKVRRLPESWPYDFGGWKNTPLWQAIDDEIADLVMSEGLLESISHEFVLEAICDAIGHHAKAIASQLNSQAPLRFNVSPLG
jgi:hypothetical protein